MTKTAYGNYFKMVVVAVAVLAVMLVVLARAKPAEETLAESPRGHIPIAFEEEGDIWVATKMRPANLTPDTANSNDVEPSVSPDGRQVAFASNRGGDFEIYLANAITGEVEQVTDNAVDDRKPLWSPDGKWISYKSSHYASPTNSGIFPVKVAGTLGSQAC